MDNSIGCCPICFDQLKENSITLLTSCGHSFCLDCTKAFVIVNSFCPIDRVYTASIQHGAHEICSKLFIKNVLDERNIQTINDIVRQFTSMIKEIKSLNEYLSPSFKNQNFDTYDSADDMKHRVYPIVRGSIEIIRKIIVGGMTLLTNDETLLQSIKIFIGDEDPVFYHSHQQSVYTYCSYHLFCTFINSLLVFEEKLAKIAHLFESNIFRTCKLQMASLHHFSKTLEMDIYSANENARILSAVFLLCDGIMVEEFKNLYTFSEECCLLCGISLSAMTYLQFQNCKHCICAFCANRFILLKPYCPFGCGDKSNNVVYKREEDDDTFMISLEHVENNYSKEFIKNVEERIRLISQLVKETLDAKKSSELLRDISKDASSSAVGRLQIVDRYNARYVDILFDLKYNEIRRKFLRVMVPLYFTLGPKMSDVVSLTSKMLVQTKQIHELFLGDARRLIESVTEDNTKVLVKKICKYAKKIVSLDHSFNDTCLIMVDCTKLGLNKVFDHEVSIKYFK